MNTQKALTSSSRNALAGVSVLLVILVASAEMLLWPAVPIDAGLLFFGIGALTLFAAGRNRSMDDDAGRERNRGWIGL